jgi:hypothetical protein
MNQSTWLKIGIPLLVFFIIGLIFYVQSGEDGPVKDETHCPDCGRELPDQAQATGECPYCKLAKLSPQPGKKKKIGNGGLAFSPLAAFFIALPIVTACLILCIRFRRNRVFYVDHEFAYFPCPYCKRRLRFPVIRAGQKGMCPRCRRPLYFPQATAKPIEL